MADKQKIAEDLSVLTGMEAAARAKADVMWREARNPLL